MKIERYGASLRRRSGYLLGHHRFVYPPAVGVWIVAAADYFWPFPGDGCRHDRLILCRYPERLRIAWRDAWMFLGTGLGSIVFFNICCFTAIELTTLSVAAILLYTAPSIVMVFSIFLFHERFTRRKGLCLVLAFAGCVLVSGLGLGHVEPLASWPAWGAVSAMPLFRLRPLCAGQI